MKITKKEKTLLFILALGIIGFGYYKLVWDYQYSELKTLESKKQSTEKEYENDVKMVQSMEPNKEEINIFNTEINNLTAGFYSSIEQPNIILELNNLMNDTNVKGTMSFSEIKTLPVIQKNDEQSNSKNSEENQNQIQGIVNDYNKIVDDKKEETSNKKSKKKFII